MKHVSSSGRGDLQRAIMRLGDFGSDEQPEAKPVAALAGLPAKKRLEKVRANISGIGAPPFVTERINWLIVRSRLELDGLVSCAMCDCVGQKIGRELRKPPAVAVDRLLNRYSRLRSRVPARSPALRRQSARARATRGASAFRSTTKPPPKAAPSQIEHVVDEVGGSGEAAVHLAKDASTLLAERSRCRSMRTPAALAASGFRRSCPSTAINCSRTIAASRCALIRSPP